MARRPLYKSEAERKRRIAMNRKYNEMAYDRVELTVAKGARDYIRKRAEEVADGSVNQYMKELIDKDTGGEFLKLEERLKEENAERIRLAKEKDGET